MVARGGLAASLVVASDVATKSLPALALAMVAVALSVTSGNGTAPG